MNELNFKVIVTCLLPVFIALRLVLASQARSGLEVKNL